MHGDGHCACTACPDPQSEPSRVLVVEDELVVRELIVRQLQGFGYCATAVASGEEALALLDRERFDLVLLDVGLPGISGFEACGAIRARSEVPIIFVTAHGDLAERLRGFDASADDYVIKPIIAEELDRRVSAVLCRPAQRRGPSGELFGPDGLALRLRVHEAYAGEHRLALTPSEFAVLRLLLEHRGEVMTADRISTAVWGYETFGSRNFVEAHVSRLRAKLRDAGAGDSIATVRGVGYVIR
ncbi:MAG: response regulator transcription factor [Dehalococcoidia bacterium]|nr:response regulator transcription factor [Dehalococcoidia bacterium]